jgi:hypothetical protein
MVRIKMENLIAIIKEGKVDNIMVASDEFAATLQEETVNVTGQEVGIGHIYANGVFAAPVKTLEEKTAEEKRWRDDELKRSDYIVPLADHPQHAAYMTYRQELRDYPTQEDFPNGTRPVNP